MERLSKINALLNKTLVGACGAALVAMVALTCANIVLRATFLPIRGTFEIMGFLGAVVTAFALGHTQIKKGHISVDVLISTFSDTTRKNLNRVNNLACMLFFTLGAWQVSIKATTLMQTGEVTETLRFAYYPFTFGVAVGCGFLAFVLFVDLVNEMVSLKGGSGK